MELTLSRVGDHYQCQCTSPAGNCAELVAYPLQLTARDELESAIRSLGRRRRETPHSQLIKRLGVSLFAVLFRGQVLDAYRLSSNLAAKDGKQLRIWLRFQGVPELLTIPWEYLYDEKDDTFMGRSRRKPLLRSLDLMEVSPRLASKPPLNVVVILSSPSNVPPIDIDTEWKGLLALERLLGRNVVRFHPIESPATLSALERLLRNPAIEYHGVHFIGHGDFERTSTTGTLLFETQKGRATSVAADTLGELLRESSIRFAVLNSCRGAETDNVDPFAGVAQALIRHGLAAVVGMQFEITSKAAVAFSEVFYEDLIRGYPIETAISDARATIHRNVNDLEWATPVLYLGSKDGHFFERGASASSLNASPTAEGETVPSPAAVRNYRWYCLLEMPGANDRYPDYLQQHIRLSYTFPSTPNTIKLICAVSNANNALRQWIDDPQRAFCWKIETVGRSLDIMDSAVFDVSETILNGATLRPRTKRYVEVPGGKAVVYSMSVPAALRGRQATVDIAVRARMHLPKDGKLMITSQFYRTVEDAEFLCSVADAVNVREMHVITGEMTPVHPEVMNPAYGSVWPGANSARSIRAIIRSPMRAGSSIRFEIYRSIENDT